MKIILDILKKISFLIILFSILAFANGDKEKNHYEKDGVSYTCNERIFERNIFTSEFGRFLIETQGVASFFQGSKFYFDKDDFITSYKNAIHVPFFNNKISNINKRYVRIRFDLPNQRNVDIYSVNLNTLYDVNNYINDGRNFPIEDKNFKKYISSFNKNEKKISTVLKCIFYLKSQHEKLRK